MNVRTVVAPILFFIFSAFTSSDALAHICPADLMEIFPPPEDAEQIQMQEAVGLFGSERTLAFVVEREYMDHSITDAAKAQFRKNGWKECKFSGWQQFIDAVHGEPRKAAFFHASFNNEHCYVEISVQQQKPEEGESEVVSRQTIMLLVRQDSTPNCNDELRK